MLLQPTPVVPRASALAVAPALLGLLILAVTVTRTTTESRFYKKRRTQLNIAATAEPAAEPAAAQAFVPDPSQHVLWFNQVGKSAGGWVGGKGANLGEMASAGMPVPPGFCITKGAFDLHLASTGTQDLLQRIERGELSTKQAHAAVLDSAMHAQVEAQVRQAYAKLGDGKVLPPAVFAGTDLARGRRWSRSGPQPRRRTRRTRPSRASWTHSWACRARTRWCAPSRSAGRRCIRTAWTRTAAWPARAAEVGCAF
jgi:hypothetical protein